MAIPGDMVIQLYYDVYDSDKRKRMKTNVFFKMALLAMFPFFQIACGDNGGGGEITPPPTKRVIKIMPIGDSLTEANEPGYRGYLYNWLKVDSLNVDFVGVNKKMPSNGGDEDHSGFGGFVIGPGASVGDEWSHTQGHGNIYYHLDKGYEILSQNCSYILLMIGINDFFNNKEDGYNPEKDGAVRLEGLVEKIFALRPDVTLLVSNLTPVAWNMQGFGSLFNEGVEDIVKRQQEQGRACYFVDTRNGHVWDAKADISEDQLHLTASGYEKVARSFYSVLKPLLSDEDR